jgi:hypothetical protein
VRLEKLTSARLTEATRTNLINQLYDRWLQTQVRSLFATPGTIAVQPQPEPDAIRDEALIDG